MVTAIISYLIFVDLSVEREYIGEPMCVVPDCEVSKISNKVVGCYPCIAMDIGGLVGLSDIFDSCSTGNNIDFNLSIQQQLSFVYCHF